MKNALMSMAAVIANLALVAQGADTPQPVRMGSGLGLGRRRQVGDRPLSW